MSLQTWEAADTALKELALLQAEINKRNARLARLSTRLNDRYQKQLNPLLVEYERLEAEIERFAWAHQPDLGVKKKSWKGTFGKISFRKKPDTFTLKKPEPQVVDALLSFCLDTVVEIKRTIKKSKLPGLPEETLRRCGIVRSPGAETVKVEPDLEAIENVTPEGVAA